MAQTTWQHQDRVVFSEEIGVIAEVEEQAEPEKTVEYARLIAAAPELLEALESAFDQAIEEGVSMNLPMQQMGQAIAKARGQ